MRDESVSFEGSSGHVLSGRIRRPAGEARGWVLLAHCFTCGKDLRAARMLTNALAEAGFAVLRFDFTGLGDSEGDFERTTFVSNVADLVHAGRWLQQTEQAPCVVVGHSLGGTAAIAAAARLPSVRAVATIGAPFSPGHAAWILDSVREELAAKGQATITLAGRQLCVGEELLRDLESASIEQDLAGLRRPLLVLHAPLDDVVGIDNARALYEAARHPKSFVSLDGADHLLGKPADARWAGKVIAAWAERALPDFGVPEPAAGSVDRQTVEVVTARGFRTEVRAGPHRLVADEPPGIGTDTGPTPYGLLLASLGACTSMTLRMYADRKEWPLEEVTVRLTHRRTHREDCEDCDAQERKLEVIERTLVLSGDLDDAQRQRLLQIADRCPVHRTLHGNLEVRTSLDEMQ
ncbi:MAG: bifunctional alpha/beta hydrolase/OsmC family protein [Myxococcales bacterium]|nr:bifunctional alpha/beta hydrolase/OsmC family protein [Myxococcales bacterium]